MKLISPASLSPAARPLDKPRYTVCFVIPAFRSELTLGRTLASVVAQSKRVWQAIVIDDGSDDRTLEIARSWAGREARISVIDLPHGGPSYARNAGIAAADSAWLVFLDSDDTVAPLFLATMLRTVDKRGGDVDVVACGSQRIDALGGVNARVAPYPLDRNPLAVCVAGPPGAIHSFLVRRSIVVDVDGFDETLTTNEDWDLWLRIAGAGGRFAVVRRGLAHYWASSNSLTCGGENMVRDARTVRERALGYRVVRTRGLELFDHAGYSIDDLTLRDVFWSAGVAIGRRHSATHLVAHVSPTAVVEGQKTHLAEKLIGGLVVGTSLPMRKLMFKWPELRGPIEEFFAALALQLPLHREGYAMMELIQVILARYAVFGGETDLGQVVAVSLRPAHLISGYRPPPRVDHVVFRLRWLKPASVFSFVAPALGAFSAGEVRSTLRLGVRRRIERRLLGDERVMPFAARLKRGRALARRFVGRNVRTPGYRALACGKARAAALRSEITPWLAGLPRRSPTTDEVLHPGSGSDAADWDRFYDREDPWNYGSTYEQLKYRRTLEAIPLDPAMRALELACAEGRFTEMLAPRVASLHAVDISANALERARRRLAGVTNTTFAEHDLFHQPIDGCYNLITCSEVLYFAPSVDKLRELAAHIAAHLEPGGCFVHAHAYELGDDPSRTAFDWDDTLGASTIFEVFSLAPRLVHHASIETELYRIDVFRRRGADPVATGPVIRELPIGAELDPEVAASVVWNGALRTRKDCEADRAYSLPVLRFGAIEPDRLEHFVRFLRRRGFRSVGPAN